MNKEQDDRIERNMCLYYASTHYLMIEDKFVSAAKTAAKEEYDIELTRELEKLLAASYKIGFADAMQLGIDSYED